MHTLLGGIWWDFNPGLSENKIRALYNDKGFLALLSCASILLKRLYNVSVSQWSPVCGLIGYETLASPRGRLLQHRTDCPLCPGEWHLGDLRPLVIVPVPGSPTKSTARGPLCAKLIAGVLAFSEGLAHSRLPLPLPAASCASCWPTWKALHFRRMK